MSLRKLPGFNLAKLSGLVDFFTMFFTNHTIFLQKNKSLDFNKNRV